jgi:ABC-type Zn2+ transport system substrate-binding protein/surface adhesin
MANVTMEDHAHPHAHADGTEHDHSHGEAAPPSQPSRAVMLDVGEHTGALVLRSSPARRGLEVEIHPDGQPDLRTHVWVLPREGRDGTTVFAAVFPRLTPGNYAVLEPDGQVATRVAVPAGVVTFPEWVDRT